MPAILLAGFMCSGKTTLGEALARRLAVRFIDLDDAIERSCGMSVSEIFRLKGEKGFREIEVQMLHRVLNENPDGVIALGGGTPCTPGVMEMLNHMGITVWLEADLDRLIPRLMQGRSVRPLLQGLETEEEMKLFVKDKLALRNPYYSKAGHQFNSSFLENESEIEASVNRFIKTILPEVVR